MMAVDSKQGTTPNQPPVGNVVAPSSPAPANGAAATNGQAKRRKRPSSLLAVASSLPSVENSLEEFIARANQTLVDASTWDNLEKTAREENDKQREVDALRWKAAETQLRESEVRENSLRNQLDGLQGRLAEAEARAAVAGTSSSDNILADLKVQIQRADQRLRDAEDRATHLAHELVSAKTSTANMRPAVEMPDADHEAAEERVRIAEAKATKALAAAKAASAGLRVSQADIAAIESGLIVTDPLDTPKRTPWVAIFIAFAGGLAIMFGVYKFGFSKTDKTDNADKAAPAATATQPETAPAPAPTKPTVTPIDEPTTAPAKTEPTTEPAPAAPDKAAAPAAPDKAVEAEIVVDKPAPVVEKVTKKTPTPAPARHHVATPAPAPVKHTAPAHAAPKEPKATGGLADPFAAAPAPAPAKKTTKAPAEKKPAGGIADPF